MLSRTPPLRSIVCAEGSLWATQTRSTRSSPSSGIAEYLTQRPGSEPPTPRRRSYTEADVPSRCDERAFAMAKGDPAEHGVVLDDPPIDAVCAGGVVRSVRISLGIQPGYPGVESRRRDDVIGGQQTKPVFVQTRAALEVRIEPRRVETTVRRNQLDRDLKV